MITTEIIDLTPELAEKLLRVNETNRPISQATIDRYERAIKRGEWRFNGESMTIFSNGGLGNGQHRCKAVIKTGISIKTVLVRGIDQSAFPTIDGGKTRSASDVLAISKEIHTAKLGAGARAYLSTQLKGRDAYCITTTQLQKCIEDHPHIRYWANRFGPSKKAKFLPSSVIGYMALSSEIHGIERLEPFFEQLCSGENLSTGAPALLLREKLMGQKETHKLSRPTIDAYIIKSINAYILGRRLTFLRHSENEPFPVIV